MDAVHPARRFGSEPALVYGAQPNKRAECMSRADHRPMTFEQATQHDVAWREDRAAGKRSPSPAARRAKAT
jgi:hypothetical protein